MPQSLSGPVQLIRKMSVTVLNELRLCGCNGLMIIPVNLHWEDGWIERMMLVEMTSACLMDIDRVQNDVVIGDNICHLNHGFLLAAGDADDCAHLVLSERCGDFGCERIEALPKLMVLTLERHRLTTLGGQHELSLQVGQGVETLPVVWCGAEA